MSRKKFIENQGASCLNWVWSWSFVNHKERFVIFGAWDINTEPGRAVILRDSWERRDGRKNNGYSQSLTHIRLVRDEGYRLFTFPIVHAGEDDGGPARIRSFQPALTECDLLRVGADWWAVSAR